MCGISGYFSRQPLSPEAERPTLESMRDALAHRGPDGSGIGLYDQAALVHNRLAIIDLNTGQQPMEGRSGKTHLVFNGEIYNYRQLRRELGHYPFSTESDTEVILALYEEFGIIGWQRLRGMFAFALWDERDQQGFLMRDPMGIKPLFYSIREDRLLFGSEAKAIFAAGIPAELDAETLHLNLNFRYPPGNRSLFKDIQQLPAGTLIQWSADSIRTIPASGTDHEPGESATFHPDRFDELFDEAVARHLESDVPIGCFLSGGIDSALIAKTALRHGPLTSYTLAMGDDPREADNAADTANWLGIHNRRMPFTIPDIIGTHRDLIRHLEAPKVNALQSMLLAEFTVPHVKVALSGLGGDELFYGYNAHQITWMAYNCKKLFPGNSNRLLAALFEPFMKNSAWTEPRRALEMFAILPDWPRAYGLLRNTWDHPSQRQLLYGERLLDTALPDAFLWLEDRFPVAGDPIKAMAEFEIQNKLINDLLWHEDRVSMRVGLETRVPFLDAEIVAYLQNLPRHNLMPYGRKKQALKTFARQVLPPSILNRPKSGFQLNIAAAAQQELRPLFDEYLSEERIQQHRLFNADFIRHIRHQPATKARRWHWFMLYLMAQTHILIEEFHVV